MYIPSAAEIQSKLRTLERASKSFKSEKSSLLEEITTLRSQISDKDKALRGVKGQMQESQDEVIKLTDRLAEVKSQKNKFSRLAREKGEEIGECEGGWSGRRGRRLVSIRREVWCQGLCGQVGKPGKILIE